MTPTSFFIALSKTLIESGIQALVIWLTVKAVLLLFPTLSARTRYTLLYAALAILSVAFISTLLLHLKEMKSAASLNGIIVNSGSLENGRGGSLIDRMITPQFSLLLTLFYISGLFANLVRLFAGVIHVNRILSYTTTEQIKIWDHRLQKLAKKS